MEIVGGNFEDRARRVFDNLRAVAGAAGGDLNQVVKLTIYLTDLSNFATINSVMEDYFDQPYTISMLARSHSIRRAWKS